MWPTLPSSRATEVFCQLVQLVAPVFIGNELAPGLIFEVALKLGADVVCLIILVGIIPPVIVFAMVRLRNARGGCGCLAIGASVLGNNPRGDWE